MTSAKLYSKSTFKHTFVDELKKNAPFTITYAIACFVTLLLPVIVIFFNRMVNMQGYEPNSLHNGYIFSLSPFIVFMLPIFGFVLGLLQFSYLTNKRAMDVYAALPMKRETAITSKVFAGVMLIIIPPMIMMIISFFVNTFVTGFTVFLLLELLFVLFEIIVFSLLPYAIVVFVSTLSGTMAENILYSITLLVMPFCLYAAYNLFMEYEIYGFKLSEEVLDILGYLLPYWGYFENLLNNTVLFTGVANEYLYSVSIYGDVIAQNEFSMWPYVSQLFSQGIVWVGVIIALLVASVFCYKARKTENADVKDASKVLTNIALFVSIIIGSMVFYLIMAALFGGFTRFIFLFAGATVAFVIFELSVHQSAKALIKQLPKLAVVFALLGVLTAFLQTQGFGIYNYIPTSGVKAVEIEYSPKLFEKGNYTDDFITEDPEIIEFITELNAVILDTDYSNGGITENAYIEDGNYYYHSYYPANYVDITYHLDNGMKVERTYSLLTNDASVMLDELNFMEEYAIDRYFVFSDDFLEVNFPKISDIAVTNESENLLMNSEFDINIFAEKLRADILENLSVEQLVEQETIGLFNYTEYSDTELVEIYGGEYDLEEAISENKSFVEIKSGYTATIEYLESLDLLKLMEIDYNNIKNATFQSPFFIESSYNHEIYGYLNKAWLNTGINEFYYENSEIEEINLTEEELEVYFENATYFASMDDIKGLVTLELLDGSAVDLAIKK